MTQGRGDTGQRRFLLVTRIGRKSLHEAWIADAAACGFDVLLSAYDPSIAPVTGPGIHFEHRAGRKVEGYRGLLEDRRDLWKRYDHVCLMDEDIAASAEQLGRMFALCAAHDLKLAQPALTHDSHFTYAALLRQPGLMLRHVNFVEMMCPVFRNDALEKVLPLFSQGLESGIDLVWCNLLFEGPGDFAVLDGVPVRHTEPVGGNKAANGFADGRTYEDDIGQALSRYRLPWLSCVPYDAVTPSGRRITSRIALLGLALPVLGAVTKQKPFRSRLRAVLVHLRHVAARPAKNIKIEVDEENDAKLCSNTGTS